MPAPLIVPALQGLQAAGHAAQRVVGHFANAACPGLRPPWQVHIMEDEDSRMHFRGLSLHRCDNEEQALNMVGGGGQPWGPSGETSHG